MDWIAVNVSYAFSLLLGMQLFVISGAFGAIVLFVLVFAVISFCEERKRAAATSQTPAAQAPVSPQPISVQVPANGYPGMPLMVQNPLTRQMITVQVPANTPPGSFFNVTPSPHVVQRCSSLNNVLHVSCNAMYCCLGCVGVPAFIIGAYFFVAACTYDMDQYYNGCG